MSGNGEGISPEDIDAAMANASPIDWSKPRRTKSARRTESDNPARMQGGSGSLGYSPPSQAQDLDSFHPPRGETERNGFWLVDLGDLGPAEPPDWLWPGYVARGACTLLVGLWKAGKTTLISHLLRDLIEGRGLVEEPIRGSIIVISEESQGLWASRRESLGLDPKRIKLCKRRSSFARMKTAEWLAMIDFLAHEIEAGDIELVVIDTVASIWPVRDENSATELGDAMPPLRDLTEAGAGLLLVHHPTKGSARAGGSARGSGFIQGFPDIIVELDKQNPASATDCRRVLKTQSRYEESSPECVIELRDDGFAVLGDRVSMGRESLLDAVEQIMRREGRALSVDELRAGWANDLPPAKSRLNKYLTGAVEGGRLTKSGGGKKGDPFRYGLPPADSIHSGGALGG